MNTLNRREFLKVMAVTGGALCIGLREGVASAASGGVATATSMPAPMLNAWVRIDADDSVTVMIDKSEMGQGVVVGLAMLVAEELDAEWARVRTEFAPTNNKIYKNRKFGMQATGGSTSMVSSWDNLRHMGAAARAMLLSAAAAQWGVPVSECETTPGVVMHKASGRRARYGELSAAAARLPLPEAALKNPAQFRLIGHSVPRPDVPDKVRGRAQFGIDVRLPGMKYATVVHAPVFGASVEAIDSSAALAIRGVGQVLDLGTGVAVVADQFYLALRGAEKLRVTWTGGVTSGFNSADLSARWAAATVEEGAEARDEGKAMAVLERKDIHRVDAVYELPYQAHACMEPMNCTADVRADRCDVWVPTQGQAGAQAVAARITGLDREQVFIHTTFLGGGFGRRGEQDFVIEAVTISQRIGAPVQVAWARAEDLQHDYYRPASYHVLRAGLAKSGVPEAWFHRLVVPPIMARFIRDAAPAMMPQWLPNSVQTGIAALGGKVMAMRIDPTAVEGAAHPPYEVPNIRVEYVNDDPGVPVGMWRSVGSSHNAFVVESFVDELATAAGVDRVEYRRKLLKKSPRHLAVLNLLAEKSQWTQPRSAGVGRGVALHECFGSVVGEVAEVTLVQGELRVTRVVCAIDCGTVVHPENVAMQMESGIVYGLTAAMKGAIELRDGRVVQSNFHDYPLLRASEMPQVEVHFVPSGATPSGVGEPGVPPIAPAVANAVFDLTRKRLRRLPFDVAALRNV